MIIALNFSNHFHSPFAMKSYRAFLSFFLVIALPVTLGIATETATDSDSTELNNPNTQSCKKSGQVSHFNKLPSLHPNGTEAALKIPKAF
jgi:hypothetical protein